MNNRSFVWELVGALSGIATVVFILISFALTFAAEGDGGLDPSNSSAQIALALADVSDKLKVSAMLGIFGMLLFIWFLGYLRRYLREAEGEGGWLTSVAYGGGLVSVAVFLGLLALEFGLTSVSGDTADTQVAKTLVALRWNYVELFSPPLVAFMAATSAVIIRFRALPRWLGWLGVLVALSLLAPWIGLLVFYPWILIVSVVLVIRVVKLQPDSKNA